MNQIIAFLHTVATTLLSEQCADTYLVEFDILNKECFSLALSKFLGYGIVLGAVAVKVPQIRNFLKSKSVEGVSLSANFLELFTVTNSLTYNYRQGNPFSTWGESFFLFVQMLVIVSLMLHFTKRTTFVPPFGIGWIGYTAALALGYLPLESHTLLLSAGIPILAVSRLLQIVEVVRNKSTGQLSFITSFLFFAGSAARVFTTIKEVDDIVILAGFLSATFFNFVTVLLFWFYPSDKAKKAKEDKKKN